jgi:hypothetical protein
MIDFPTDWLDGSIQASAVQASGITSASRINSSFPFNDVRSGTSSIALGGPTQSSFGGSNFIAFNSGVARSSPSVGHFSSPSSMSLSNPVRPSVCGSNLVAFDSGGSGTSSVIGPFSGSSSTSLGNPVHPSVCGSNLVAFNSGGSGTSSVIGPFSGSSSTSLGNSVQPSVCGSNFIAFNSGGSGTSSVIGPFSGLSSTDLGNSVQPSVCGSNLIAFNSGVAGTFSVVDPFSGSSSMNPGGLVQPSVFGSNDIAFSSCGNRSSAFTHSCLNTLPIIESAVPTQSIFIASNYMGMSSATLSLVHAGLIGTIGSDVETWRDNLVDHLLRWSDTAKETSQRKFWRLFDTLDKSFVHYNQPYPAGLVSPWASLLTEGPSDRVFCDGLLRELSGRAIRTILETVAIRVSAVDEPRCAAEILAVLHTSLMSEVSSREHRNWSARAPLPRSLIAPSTHDWVLSFAFHTGISPPTSADARPAIGRALFNSAARNDDHETVRRRKRSTNLRDTVRLWSSRACVGRGSRSHAFAGCRSQPARRGSDRSHYSMEKCA